MSHKPSGYSVTAETSAGDVRNALTILQTAAVREGGSVRYEEADVELVLRRLRAAVRRLEEGDA